MNGILHGIATALAYLVTFIIGFGAGILCTMLMVG